MANLKDEGAVCSIGNHQTPSTTRTTSNNNVYKSCTGYLTDASICRRKARRHHKIQKNNKIKCLCRLEEVELRIQIFLIEN